MRCQQEKIKPSEFLIQCGATMIICFLACQTGFVYSWPSYTTALFKSNDTVLSTPMSTLQPSLLGSMSNVGRLLVSPFCSYAFNTLGRKYATMLFALPYVLTWTIISRTTNVTLVLLALSLGGVGIAGQNVSIIYISEISHDSIRGGLSAGSAAGCCLGLLISNILGGYLSYMQVVHTHLALAVLSLVLMMMLMMLKESPAYLVLKGREKEAAESIAFYRRLDLGSKEVEAEISKIRLQLDPTLKTMLEFANDPETAIDLITTKEKLEVELRAGTESSWKLLLRSKSSKRALFTVLTILILTIMMGCVVLQTYTEPLFKEAVPSMPSNLCAILVALDFLVASLVTVARIDRCGRKMLLIISSTISGVCTLVLGAQLQFHWFPPWCTALLIYVYSFVYSTGCASISFVLASEVFLPEVRSLCNSIVMASVWIFIGLTLFAFNPVVEHVGLGPMFCVFSCVCFLGAAYSYYCVPETKRLSVTEIQRAFLTNN